METEWQTVRYKVLSFNKKPKDEHSAI